MVMVLVKKINYHAYSFKTLSNPLANIILITVYDVIGLGSVEGLAYEPIDNMLYWTCNNDATINKVNLSESWTSLKPETIIKLGPSDKPRGIAVDSCDW
jgi:hypothetical protein